MRGAGIDAFAGEVLLLTAYIDAVLAPSAPPVDFALEWKKVKLQCRELDCFKGVVQ